MKRDKKKLSKVMMMNKIMNNNSKINLNKMQKNLKNLMKYNRKMKMKMRKQIRIKSQKKIKIMKLNSLNKKILIFKLRKNK